MKNFGQPQQLTKVDPAEQVGAMAWGCLIAMVMPSTALAAVALWPGGTFNQRTPPSWYTWEVDEEAAK